MTKPLVQTLLSCLFVGAIALPAQSPAAAHPIDLAICLDVSGSMNGLINQARQNLWAVVNELAALEPVPQLRVALLTYGGNDHDPARGWVKVRTDFTTDLDSVSEQLFSLSTSGSVEYVARAVRTAVDELQWSAEPHALRLMFVAGNEQATQDPQLPLPVQCGAAVGKGIVVNAIYCGPAGDAIAPGWRDVAKWAEGQFAAIDQDRQEVITTPLDGRISELSAALNATYIEYGARGIEMAQNQVRQDANAARLNAAAAATRGQTKAGGFYNNAHWDLVDASRDPKFDLGAVKREYLQEALRSLDAAQLRLHIEIQRQKREELQKQIAELGRQRDLLVARQQQAQGGGGGLQTAMLEAVRKQAAAKGFHRRVVAEVNDPKTAAIFSAILQDAVRDYRSFVCVAGQPRRAPTDCRMPGPAARVSTAGKEHGEKVYRLFARHAVGLEYIQPGVPAAVGQTLVKESWVCENGMPAAATAASAQLGHHLIVNDGGKVGHAGDYFGLFVMHKLPPETPGTDQGWIYGTIDAKGSVTAIGSIASCMRCHQDAAEDRRFGLR